MTDRELMQQALDALKVMRPACFAETTLKKADTAITALRDRLAQPEQEPVAWVSENAGLYHGRPDESLNPLPLYLAPPPCPTCEALARTVMLDQTSHDTKRQWVGLTMLEMSELRQGGFHNITDERFRAIEAKLKEKNT